MRQGLILLPYFLGEKIPVNDLLARGVLLGVALTHTRAHVYRAILEGIAYGFRHHLAVLAERGLTATRARVTNGGARSALWKQVTADVLGTDCSHLGLSQARAWACSASGERSSVSSLNGSWQHKATAVTEE